MLLVGAAVVVLGLLTPLPPHERSPVRRVSARREVIGGAAALLGLAASPLRAGAVCSCPSGFNSCVCTDDPPAAPTGAVTGRRRLDAAGRDAADAAAETAEMRGQKPAPGKKRMSLGDSPPQEMMRRTDPNSMPVMPTRGGLTGFGSMEDGEKDVSGAKQRFQAIVAETVKRREAEFGFELDKDDIKQIETVLRIKYCGKEGLIGPC